MLCWLTCMLGSDGTCMLSWLTHGFVDTATGHAVNVKYSWHYRARSTWVEEFSSAKVGARTEMSGSKPLSLAPLAQLYSSKHPCLSFDARSI